MRNNSALGVRDRDRFAPAVPGLYLATMHSGITLAAAAGRMFLPPLPTWACRPSRRPSSRPTRIAWSSSRCVSTAWRAVGTRWNLPRLRLRLFHDRARSGIRNSITRITCTSTWHRTAARTTTASANNRRGPMRGGALQWASANRFQDTILDRSQMLCQVCQYSVSNLRVPRKALPLIIISTLSSIP